MSMLTLMLTLKPNPCRDCWWWSCSIPLLEMCSTTPMRNSNSAQLAAEVIAAMGRDQRVCPSRAPGSWSLAPVQTLKIPVLPKCIDTPR